MTNFFSFFPLFLHFGERKEMEGGSMEWHIARPAFFMDF